VSAAGWSVGRKPADASSQAVQDNIATSLVATDAYRKRKLEMQEQEQYERRRQLDLDSSAAAEKKKKKEDFAAMGEFRVMVRTFGCQTLPCDCTSSCL
jgi:hypothetical protein